MYIYVLMEIDRIDVIVFLFFLFRIFIIEIKIFKNIIYGCIQEFKKYFEKLDNNGKNFIKKEKRKI